MGIALTGCGPGFPIMTGEQETLIKNVDNLLKENAALKSRVAQLETKEASTGNKDFEDLRKSIAEANASIDKLRQDVSFIQGGIEEADHKNEQIRQSVAGLTGLNERLTAIEASIRDNDKKFESLKGSFDAHEKKLADLAESVSSADKRAASIEERLSAASNPAQKKTTPEDPEAVYLKGYKETIDKDFASATETFQSFLASYPDHKFAANAQYWLGEIYYAKGDWERAIIEFDKAIKKYPKSEKIPASILKQGFSFERLGSKKEAKVLLQEVIEKFPKSSEATIAKKRLETFK